MLSFDPRTPLTDQDAEPVLRRYRDKMGADSLPALGIILDGVRSGSGFAEVSRLVRPFFPLSLRDQARVQRYRDLLHRGSVLAAGFPLRDRRRDPTVRKASTGKKIPPEIVQRIIHEYGRRLHAYRTTQLVQEISWALLEAYRAANTARNAVLLQAMKNEDLALSSRLSVIWDASSEAEQEHASEVACGLIDASFDFPGAPVDLAQRASWPRVGAFYGPGSPIEDVPAAYEITLRYVARLYLAGMHLDAQRLQIVPLVLSVIGGVRRTPDG